VPLPRHVAIIGELLSRNIVRRQEQKGNFGAWQTRANDKPTRSALAKKAEILPLRPSRRPLARTPQNDDNPVIASEKTHPEERQLELTGRV
jgi:hypothetical protein